MTDMTDCRTATSRLSAEGSPIRQKVERLEAEMLAMPQIEIQLRHFFIAGVYAREMTVPKGAAWTGKIHKYHQINILSKGDMSVVTENGVIRVQAPFTYVSEPGAKRAGYAHEDSVWTCFLSTHGQDISAMEMDQIESMFVADSEAEYLTYVGDKQ